MRDQICELNYRGTKCETGAKVRDQNCNFSYLRNCHKSSYFGAYNYLQLECWSTFMILIFLIINFIYLFKLLNLCYYDIYVLGSIQIVCKFCYVTLYLYLVNIVSVSLDIIDINLLDK